MPSFELDNEFLEIFYSLTNSEVPSDITTFGLKRQLNEIVELVKNINKDDSKTVANKSLNPQNENNDESTSGPAILVVDDLGVITYQLKVLLSRYKYDVDCSQEIYDAVNKYKKRKYDYVIMDLFIPTEREGFILLTELKKMSLAANHQTVIGVITASARKEIDAQCKNRGADFFLEKNSDWQNSLIGIMDSYINVGKEDEEF